jgi:hypothetical protein
MIRRATIAALGATLVTLLAAPGAAAGEESGAPAWQTTLVSTPTVLRPGAGGDKAKYVFTATNVGGSRTSGEIDLEDALPAGLTPAAAGLRLTGGGGDGSCEIASQIVSCTTETPVRPGFSLVLEIRLSVDPLAPPSLEDQTTISGGGALAASATTTTTIGTSTPPFDFLAGPAGLSAPATAADGSAVTLAGAHPYQLTVGLGFPSEYPGGLIHGIEGGVRDAGTDLPRGLIVDPAATSRRCTESELLGAGCPAASQLGLAAITTPVANTLPPELSPLYNMVPPPGSPSSFAFDVSGAGAFAHILGSLRSDGDYGLTGGSTDIVGLSLHPILGVTLHLWGDPAGAIHDELRSDACFFPASMFEKPEPSCPLSPAETTGAALLSMPGTCPSTPSITIGRADSWAQPGLFHEAVYESADLAGNPIPISGCTALEFAPTLAISPTTNLADSPSGLDVDLHQPQEAPRDNPLQGRASASLKDAVVSLPSGLVANPSQADGLAACTEAQIGYLSEGHYSKQPNSCPDAAKLGTVEVASPLLAEYGEGGTKLETDPETGRPIPRPLQGSVYLAKPFENEFGSLLAIYLAVEDEESGTVAKLAGKVVPDPQTGRLTTVFEENPDLPIEDVRLHLFGGARASLTTPISCGTHTTTSDLTPWTSPEGADAHPSDSFQTTAEPGGGSCPSSEDGAANSPGFSAGTLSPQAAAYSPFVLKLHREDGSQRLAGIDTTLPPGLVGKLAGIAECSEGQISQARSRENPEEGIDERESPSCPLASEVGVVNVGAGSGPTPFYTQGHAYLAGPYKGAPLSLAVIVPAIAGPFDLGTVVSRVALHIEPETAQVHAVSDPLPQILDGIPLDIRSVALKMDRPQFILNPTSCEPMAITGTALTALGNPAGLSERFQVGGCSGLRFKPKLSLRLKGSVKRSSNPRLIANLSAKPGEADIARAQVKLPHSVFLDQAHIRTICTRVQFAADACPAGSIYGKAEATTPLLDQPLSGAVYLRSSSHPLPDLVAKLKGPASQPVEIDLVGKTDAVKAALRNTFEAVPDAPVSHFRLELFGGKRGLVEMSDGFCAGRRATVQLTAHNGRSYDTRPVVGAKCPKHRKHRHHKKHKRG